MLSAYTFLSLLLTTVAICPAQTEPSEAAIRHLIERYVAVRNHMDVAVLRQLLTPDVDQLVSTGQWRRGLEDTVQGAAASSKKENGHSDVTLESVRMLGSDAAIADGRYETTAVSDTATRKMWTTFILRRLNGEWKIAAIRNMLPAPSTR